MVTEVCGKDRVTGLKLHNVKTDELLDLSVDGLFIFIGNTPNTQFVHGQLEMDANGYILVNHLMETSVAGVFAAGEVCDPTFRQVVTSAGMGAAAAIQASRFLECK